MCNHDFLTKETEDVMLWKKGDVYNYKCIECNKGFFVPDDLIIFELEAQDHGCERTVEVLERIIEKKEKSGGFGYDRLENLAKKIFELVSK
jgi:hypothetical protein